MNTTEISLLIRLQSGKDEIAWTRFVDLYAPLIFYWSRQKGLNSEDASDLSQEVLAVLVKKLPEFRYNSNKRFRGWLRTITINKANDFFRRNAARPDAKQKVLELKDSIVNNRADLLDEAEYRKFLVQQAMRVMRAEFNDDSWRVFQKHVIEGMKAVDVAREFGTTVNTVYLAKSRILARLRVELNGLLD